MMKKLLFILLVLSVACEQEERQQISISPYFKINAFVNSLIQSQTELNAPVYKTTWANDMEETAEVDLADSAFWKTELTPLLSADINKPSLLDVYRVQQGLPENTSNLLRTVYEANPKSDASVKKLEVKYLKEPSEVRQIIAVIEKDNPVYNSFQKVNLWTNKYGDKLLIDSLKITGYNKTIFQDSLIYQTSVKVRH